LESAPCDDCENGIVEVCDRCSELEELAAAFGRDPWE
jgi:hypothetical protein